MKHLFTLSERLKGRGRGSVTSAISATSASAIFCKLVGMVKLFMPFMKATKRQSDTTIFAESLKSLMSIFAESAESAESAKPIFANRGVKDVRVSLAQSPTNIQRISNLYITPNRYLTRFAAVFALVFCLGVGNVWGSETVYKTATFSTSNCTDNSSYTGSVTCTVGDDSWTAANAANNNGGWAYIKMGAKKAKAADATKVTTGTITTSAAYGDAITKVVVYGTIERGSVATKLIYASNSAFSTNKVEVTGPTTFTDGKMTFTISSPVASRFYKLEFVCSNTTTTNGVIQITKVEYYHAAAEPYTVSFNTGIGNPELSPRAEISGGAGITLPSTSDLTPTCSGDGWTLYGWTTAAYGSSSTTTAPTATLVGLAGAAYTPTSNITLHAVYIKSITSGDPVAQTLSFSYASHEGWNLSNCTDQSTYWLLEKYNSAYVESPTISDLSSITSISVNAGYYGGAAYGKFKIYGAGTQYGSEQSPSTNKASGGPYDVSPDTNPLSGSGKIKIECTGTSSSGNGTRLGNVTINYTAVPTINYYWSNPTCCTALAQVEGSANLSQWNAGVHIY